MIGASLAARAAQELTTKAGIDSSTVARLLMADHDQPVLTAATVLVVDEAAMVGTRQLAPLLDSAEQASAKVVLVGDHRQLPEIDAGGAFRGLLHRLDPIELTVNRRQQHAWERHALDALRAGDVGEALDAFDHAGRITICGSGDQTLQQMVDDWWAAASDELDPTAHGVMLTLRRNDVDQLNARARRHLAQAGRLGADAVAGGDGREFAVGDAVVCTANAPALQLFNGLRGQLTAVNPATGAATLRLPDGQHRQLPASYLREGKLAHAYALTGHKAQGLDVPRAWVLGSDLLYREWAYTALSRHQHSVQLYLTGDAEPPDWVEHPLTLAADARTPLQQLTANVSVSRAQHLAVDQGTGPAGVADWASASLHLQRLLVEALAHAPGSRGPGSDSLDNLATRLQIIETDPPRYLTAALGPLPSPSEETRSRAWRAGSLAVEDYRLRWRIDDPDHPLGPAPTDPTQQTERDQAAATLRRAQRDLGLVSRPAPVDLGLTT